MMMIGGVAMTANSDELNGQATLDIFSGRPNPTWTLSATEAQELRNHISALSTSLPNAAEVPDLGYRGVRVALSSTEVTVGHGSVAVETGGKTTNFADAGRQLERWLLHTAQGKIAPDVLKIAEGDLRAPP
jgi:hypothetical protein